MTRDGRIEPRAKYKNDPIAMRYYKRTSEARRAASSGSGSGDGRRKSGRLADRAPADYAEGSDDNDSSSASEPDQFRVEARGEIESGHESGNGQESEDSDEDYVQAQNVPPAQQLGQGGGRHLGHPRVYAPSVPDFVQRANYKGTGMTKRVKTLRSEDPSTQQQVMYDYRFRTLFQIDFYTTVI